MTKSKSSKNKKQQVKVAVVAPEAQYDSDVEQTAGALEDLISEPAVEEMSTSTKSAERSCGKKSTVRSKAVSTYKRAAKATLGEIGLRSPELPRNNSAESYAVYGELYRLYVESFGKLARCGEYVSQGQNALSTNTTSTSESRKSGGAPMEKASAKTGTADGFTVVNRSKKGKAKVAEGSGDRVAKKRVRSAAAIERRNKVRLARKTGVSNTGLGYGEDDFGRIDRSAERAKLNSDEMYELEKIVTSARVQAEAQVKDLRLNNAQKAAELERLAAVHKETEAELKRQQALSSRIALAAKSAVVGELSDPKKRKGLEGWLMKYSKNFDVEASYSEVELIKLTVETKRRLPLDLARKIPNFYKKLPSASL